jgi:hypothetical protein
VAYLSTQHRSHIVRSGDGCNAFGVAKDPRDESVVGLTLILVGMTQLRTAALLVVGVPIFAAICVIALQPRHSSSRSAVLVLATIVIGLVFNSIEQSTIVRARAVARFI